MNNLFPISQNVISFDPFTVIVNLITAFLLSLAIAYVYKATHKGLSYSQSFVMTLVIGGVVIAAVMMVIGNNIARAFGAFGAFSLIRFRTAVKDTKDMGFIFLVLAVGMSVGTNNYFIGIATTAIVLLIIVVLNKINFGSIRKFDYILYFNIDTKIAQDNDYRTVFDKFLKSSNVLNIKALGEGNVLQMSFSIKFIKESDKETFTHNLGTLNGVTDVNVITAKNDVEY